MNSCCSFSLTNTVSYLSFKDFSVVRRMLSGLADVNIILDINTGKSVFFSNCIQLSLKKIILVGPELYHFYLNFFFPFSHFYQFLTISIKT